MYGFLSCGRAAAIQLDGSPQLRQHVCLPVCGVRPAARLQQASQLAAETWHVAQGSEPQGGTRPEHVASNSYQQDSSLQAAAVGSKHSVTFTAGCKVRAAGYAPEAPDTSHV